MSHGVARSAWGGSLDPITTKKMGIKSSSPARTGAIQAEDQRQNFVQLLRQPARAQPPDAREFERSSSQAAHATQASYETCAKIC